MPSIIGIDPGSRATGWGVIVHCNNQPTQAFSGVIKTSHKDLTKRLCHISAELRLVLQQHNPDEAAIEQVFVRLNPRSALTLGQARGVALLACGDAGLAVAEYAPRVIKKSCVGYGAADKAQMQQMITNILKLKEIPSSDAADALAIALCHMQHLHWQHKIKESS